MTEYLILVVLIALTVMAAVKTLGADINAKFKEAGEKIAGMQMGGP